MSSREPHYKLKNRVRRPTEERALGRFARECLRKGITQRELMRLNAKKSGRHQDTDICHCTFCRLERSRGNWAHRILLKPKKMIGAVIG